MKACSLIVTAAATAALAVPVAQAAGRNGLQCSGSATPTKSDSSFYNHRPLLSASSCTSTSRRTHITSISVASIAGTLLGTDAGQAQQRAARAG